MPFSLNLNSKIKSHIKFKKMNIKGLLSAFKGQNFFPYNGHCIVPHAIFFFFKESLEINFKAVYSLFFYLCCYCNLM